MANVRIGISGWRYGGWRGSFYPDGLQQRRELEYAAARLDTIEINGSFYSLQRPAYYARWRDETPEGFVFAVKGSRFITHMKRLRDVRPALANFFASGVLALREKLGPVLWQFPERDRFDAERYDAFLRLLPRDTFAAAELARLHHDHRVAGWGLMEADARRPIRHAFEVRHPSFMDPAFIRLLRTHRAALVLADTAGVWPYAEDLTSDFVYIRLHGSTELYHSAYTDEEIEWWAERIRHWADGTEPPDAKRVGGPARARPASGRDVYVYFDNDAKVEAPFDAMRLRRRLGRFERSAASA